MPRLSPEKRKEIQKLATRPDREIDLSDIPEIRQIPSDAVIGKFYRPKKITGTIKGGGEHGNSRLVPMPRR
jgi:hypothetical protein